jgi:hypothetical protein
MSDTDLGDGYDNTTPEERAHLRRAAKGAIRRVRAGDYRAMQGVWEALGAGNQPIDLGLSSTQFLELLELAETLEIKSITAECERRDYHRLDRLIELHQFEPGEDRPEHITNWHQDAAILATLNRTNPVRSCLARFFRRHRLTSLADRLIPAP